MMTSVSAAAMRASGVDWLRMLRRLRGVRKASLIRLMIDHQRDDDDEHRVVAARRRNR